jgi:hypothetical protein
MNFGRHILVLILALPFQVYAGHFLQEFQSDSWDESFGMNNPFELTLETDFQAFADNLEEEEYLPAMIHYSLENGSVIEQAVEVKARGQYRRRRCELPPVRINFKGKKYQVDLFNNLGKTKLVNACGIDSTSEKYLIREYLAYQIYEILTEYSFRTWFLKIRFVDTRGTSDAFTSLAFLIEDADDLAARIEGREIETQGLGHDELDPETEAILSMFQFMIGNTDWALTNLHNMKLVALDDPGMPLPEPIPYDFDFSGLVNAPYARPSDDFPIETVRDRFYRGECRSRKITWQTIRYFQEKEQAILDLVNSFDFLDEPDRQDILTYIGEFYEILGDRKMAKKEIYLKCQY